MRRLSLLLGMILMALVCFAGEMRDSRALDTAVVGIPPYYGYYPYPGYYDYGAVPYVGALSPYYFGNNPNPALQPGSVGGNPFFLGNQVQRNTGIRTRPALNDAGQIFFLNNAAARKAYPY